MSRMMHAYRPLRIVRDGIYIGRIGNDEKMGFFDGIILPLEDSRSTGAADQYEEFLGIHNSEIFKIILRDDEIVRV